MYVIGKVIAVIFFYVYFLYSASIEGTVTDYIDKVPIKEAVITIIHTDTARAVASTITDEEGYFNFPDLEPGRYHIQVLKEGYYKNILFDYKIFKDGNYRVNIKLLKGDRECTVEYCFLLGSIEVIVDSRELINRDLTTVRKIFSGDIEHLQASNLGDILYLVPGLEKSKSLGLSRDVRVGVRSITNVGMPGTIESFGTSIIINGREVSNDGNAKQKGQTGIYGIDLREIPADNIKEVRVISGIPSVEYGNFANGIIEVITKYNYVRPKLKVKLNPDTKAASLTSGLKFKDSAFNWFFNYAYSERDLRKKGDEYHRFYFSGNYSGSTRDKKLDYRLSYTYTRLLDNQKPTDIYRMKTFNRGYLASGSFSLDYRYSNDRILSAIMNMGLNRRWYYQERWVAEQLVTPDTIYNGYIGKLNEIGKELNYFIKVKERIRRKGLVFDHNFLKGFEFDFRRNIGPGMVIDSVFNFYGANSPKRSYSFDDMDPIYRLTFFYEDNISTYVLSKKLEAMAGIRYDVINPERISLKDGLFRDRHGEYLSPRLNIGYWLGKTVRVRIGAGRSVKSVSLAYVNRSPAYCKYMVQDSIVEEKRSQRNRNLKAYCSDRYEISVDWQFRKDIGLSLTGYLFDIDRVPVLIEYPWNWESNPEEITSKTYSRFENRGWLVLSGLELIMRTRRIKNFKYDLNITYRYQKKGQYGKIYDPAPDTTWEQIWYVPPYEWQEKIILDHCISFVSDRLGLWVSIDLQHILLNHYKKVFQSNSTLVEINGVRRIIYQGMSDYRYWERYLKSYPQKFIFSLRLTKSIGHNTEISIYINNILDDRAVYYDRYENVQLEMNPPIYYGIELSKQW